jgi:hypothetical protein
MALADGDIWSAFVIVHRRYDATLLPCLSGPVAHLNTRVHSFLNDAVPSPTIDPRMLEQIKRAITGICKHIAALDLFVASSPQDTVVDQQKKGIAFYTRDPPTQPTNTLASYRGYMINDRLEALVCAAMLTMLCLAAGYRPSCETLEPANEVAYRPYYHQKFVDRYPDRRSCAQLSFAAQNFRQFKFSTATKSAFRPIAESPIGPPPKPKGRKGKGNAKKSEPSAPDVVPDAYFSLGDLQMRAGLPNEGETFPAAMTLSWFAARIKKFASSVE